MNMLEIGSLHNLTKNLRPLSIQAECASAGFCVRGRDHAIGLSTLALIAAAWIFILLYI